MCKSSLPPRPRSCVRLVSGSGIPQRFQHERSARSPRPTRADRWGRAGVLGHGRAIRINRRHSRAPRKRLSAERKDISKKITLGANKLLFIAPAAIKDVLFRAAQLAVGTQRWEGAGNLATLEMEIFLNLFIYLFFPGALL